MSVITAKQLEIMREFVLSYMTLEVLGRGFSTEMTQCLGYAEIMAWHAKHLTVSLNPFQSGNIHKAILKCSVVLKCQSCQVNELSRFM